MSYQNDSRKSGAPAKTAGNAKESRQTKEAQNSRSETLSLGSQQTQASRGSFHSQDIKSLVHNQGRAKLGGQEWTLKAPSWNDAVLQEIISDPKFTVKPSGKPTADGKCSYELKGHGETIKVTIGH